MPRHIIMDASGHTTINFDTASLTDLAEARRRFHKLVAVRSSSALSASTNYGITPPSGYSAPVSRHEAQQFANSVAPKEGP